MALRISDIDEFSRRLAYVMKAAKVPAKTLSLKMGKPKGYVSWLTTEAKSVDPVIAGKIADVLAGIGALTEDSVAIVSYLLGITHDTYDLLRLQSVEAGVTERSFASTTADKANNLYFAFTPSDLLEQVAS